ncbi:transcriptional repressor, partial [Candidatus Bipolaricaulota bacterium]|nr:transcriptional repressor [Candidatus Bipolaricaulota bacterium]
IGRVHATGERVRFDGNPARHHHFICTECGEIIDFASEALDELELPEELEKLGTIASRQLQVLGVCRDCARRKERSDD